MEKIVPSWLVQLVYNMKNISVNFVVDIQSSSLLYFEPLLFHFLTILGYINKGWGPLDLISESLYDIYKFQYTQI